MTSSGNVVIPVETGIQESFYVLKTPCVYILASQRNGTLYIGVTSDLVKRVWQHRNNLIEGFTKRYGVHILVWYESHETLESAITREKNIKKWNREWKLSLIEKSNPLWQDLYDQLT
ncbi:MAG: GIY-YIG nuclease family protein [Deltaproteobacteria bacterium]|nr:GIY-YIG nuclease family protein [Deltaproteobacteria bacterium]